MTNTVVSNRIPGGAPLISVIVPIYNSEETLQECLGSIAAQTMPDFEVLMINDGSTDDSVKFAQEYAATDDRFILINKDNGGYGSACNEGLNRARGTWISIIESDDYIDPEMYADLIECASRATHAEFKDDGEVEMRPPDVVKAPYWRLIENIYGGVDKKLCHYAGRVKVAQQPFTIEEAAILLKYHPSIWSAIYRRKFLESEGIRFLEIPGAGWADNPFMAETLLRAKSIAYSDKPHYCYREQTGSEEAEYLRKNPFMPEQRWFEVMEVAADAGVTDVRVMEALYKRGLNNLARVNRAGGLSADQLAEVTSAMYSVMDPNIVMASREIPTHEKIELADTLDVEADRNPMPYIIYIAAERLRDIRRVGFIYSLRTLIGRVKK